MNREKLKLAEATFFQRYPGGFSNPEMVAIGKKHKMEKMINLAKESFAPEQFSHPQDLIEKMIKLVSSSSMISVFEKPKFRDYVRSLNSQEQDSLIKGLKEMLYGEEELGFNKMLEILRKGKLAKWTLMTVVPAYLRPEEEVFVKPTTVKNVITTFELEDLVYNPTPSYDFYNRYRAAVNQMKTLVAMELSPSNAAFSGFLMMTMQKL